MKPQMMVKWADEQTAHRISRRRAAAMIRANRGHIDRKGGEMHIVSKYLGVTCIIYRREP